MKIKGSVLMISLWVLSLLVLFAIGIGHRASIELRMSRYYADRLKANYLARAGVNQAVAVLVKDEAYHNTTGNPYDAFNEEWSSGIDSFGNKTFENITINPGIQTGSSETFTVQYPYRVDPAGNKEYKCIQDEQGKININQLTFPVKATLSMVFTAAGITSAENLVNLTEQWTNATVNTTADPGNVFKHNLFKMPEELQLVLEYYYSGQPGTDAFKKSQEVYSQVKNYITVYGNTSKININTVSPELLNCYINATASILAISVPQVLADSILRVRNDTRDNYFMLTDITATSTVLRPILDKFMNKAIGLDDDSLRMLNDSWFPSPQFNSSEISVTSQDFRIESTGNVNNVQKTVTAVFDRAGKEIVYWHEN